MHKYTAGTNKVHAVKNISSPGPRFRTAHFQGPAPPPPPPPLSAVPVLVIALLPGCSTLRRRNEILFTGICLLETVDNTEDIERDEVWLGVADADDTSSLTSCKGVFLIRSIRVASPRSIFSSSCALIQFWASRARASCVPSFAPV